MLCVTGSLLAFEQFYILTKGGPDNSTITVVQLIYNVAFQGQNNLGVAGALSVIVLARPRRSSTSCRSARSAGKGGLTHDRLARPPHDVATDRPPATTAVARTSRGVALRIAVLGAHRRRSP